MVEDVFFKKTIPFKFWKHELQFKTSQTLFSSHDVDAGTRLLLRTVVEAGGEKPSRILDMGCGYGDLGLTLQSLYPQSYAQLVDRDALAVEYSRLNAALNGLENVECYGSLGYDDVDRAD